MQKLGNPRLTFQAVWPLSFAAAVRLWRSLLMKRRPGCFNLVLECSFGNAISVSSWGPSLQQPGGSRGSIMSPESTHHRSAITSAPSSLSTVINFSGLPIRFTTPWSHSLSWEFSVGGRASVLCLKSRYHKTNKVLTLCRGDKKRRMTPEAVSSMSHSSPTSHCHVRSHTHTPPRICVALMWFDSSGRLW